MLRQDGRVLGPWRVAPLVVARLLPLAITRSTGSSRDCGLSRTVHGYAVCATYPLVVFTYAWSVCLNVAADSVATLINVVFVGSGVCFACAALDDAGAGCLYHTSLVWIYGVVLAEGGRLAALEQLLDAGATELDVLLSVRGTRLFNDTSI